MGLEKIIRGILLKKCLKLHPMEPGTPNVWECLWTSFFKDLELNQAHITIGISFACLQWTIDLTVIYIFWAFMLLSYQIQFGTVVPIILTLKNYTSKLTWILVRQYMSNDQYCDQDLDGMPGSGPWSDFLSQFTQSVFVLQSVMILNFIQIWW